MKKIMQFILFLVATGANSQSDILIWKSDTLNIYSNLLELKNDWIPLQQVFMERIEEKRSGTKLDSLIEIVPWDNYKTEWIINNDSLYLTKISSIYKLGDELNLQKFFGKEQRTIFAEWVDESIITFEGNCIVCTANHGKNNSIYPKETVFKFQKGILSSLTNYRNFISKKSEFSSVNPDAQLDFVYGNINWSELPDLDGKSYQVRVSVKPNRNGKLDQVDWNNSYLIVGESLIQNRENVFIKEAIRIAKKIPDWDVVFRQNKILNQGITILFSEEMKKNTHVNRMEGSVIK